MDRNEHLEWAKERAREQRDKTSSVAAWIGFKHDMWKHDEIKSDPTITFLLERGDDLCKDAVRPILELGLPVRLKPLENKLMRFIEDFN